MNVLFMHKYAITHLYFYNNKTYNIFSSKFSLKYKYTYKRVNVNVVDRNIQHTVFTRTAKMVGFVVTVEQ